MILSAPAKGPEAFPGPPSLSGGDSFFSRRLFSSNSNLLFRPPVRPTLSLTFARRRNQNSSSSSSPSSSKKNKRNLLPKGGRDKEEDAIELLFNLLEEDLKNDARSLDGDDDDDGEEEEFNDEDVAKLERELALALGIDVDEEEEEEEEEENEEEQEDVEDDEEVEMPVKLKNWQLRRLAVALKNGRRKTSIKNLAAELCLDRAIVLDLLREPPPSLLMLSASLPDPPRPSIPETKTLETTDEEPIEVDSVEGAEKVKVPVHVMQQSWAAQKRLKKVQVETLERVYRRTKRPTNAMISSVVQVTNLPRKRIVKWFEDKRASFLCIFLCLEKGKEMMILKSNFVVFVALLFLLASNNAKGQTVIDIVKKGAKPHSDISKILEVVWKEACASPTRTKIVIPKGEFTLTEAKLTGPCKKPIEINVNAKLKAPLNPIGEAMLNVKYVDRLTMTGNGVFDGNGKKGWERNDCHKNTKTKKCVQLPMNIKFGFVTNTRVTDITSLDSKSIQINVFGCKNFTFQNVKVIAPAESPNIDGIHVGTSDEIYILDSKIATGDDCVSLGDKMTQIHITNVTCGPGHGFSLGSLGRNTKEKAVKGIFITKCKMIGSDNGVRIKTWPDSPIISQVSDIHFEDIEMVNVKNPIVIDQEYCPHDQCNKQVPSKVKISGVTFKNIKGTSATPVAVMVRCSKTYPCSGVSFENINLTYNGKEGKIVSQCLNLANPKVSGKQNPKICGEIAPTLLKA